MRNNNSCVHVWWPWPLTYNLASRSWHFLMSRARSFEILFKSTMRIRSYGLDKLGRTPDKKRHNIIRPIWRRAYKNARIVRQTMITEVCRVCNCQGCCSSGCLLTSRNSLCDCRLLLQTIWRLGGGGGVQR
jgi:hypothetical protein